ncbi:hypothetical protein PAESOLCIP111_05157 [Paenibacillus solanacearum]|uniref:FAD-dependent oxidoreductase n=1 Tax=Paenibacillus solanacearum TaxID=2048548 RepID=A0A916NRZ7_9BACL|nr:FAD-dependent oxidoreductase [Paenibacillus solanacearum]CAG7646388.1 hypothetical protein PAESOLCIP111_05157 [Paenibacillus solanacearum]
MDTLETDVLVVGGGTAGVMAAIGAAEEGARVVLVERDNMLGGVGVCAGVHFYYYGSLGGIQNRVDRQVRELSKLTAGKSKGFHPEWKGLVLTDYMERLGIRIVYDAVVAQMNMDGNKVHGALVETATGQLQVKAKVTIDSTGDGDIAYLCGADFTKGRAWDGALHTYSLVPRYVDDEKVLRYKNFDVGWADTLDLRDLSRAYRTGRRTAWRYEETPENTHYTTVGPQLGVREGRYIVGEYVLGQDDLLLDRRFDDVVMQCFSHHDTHAFDYANESELTQIYIAVLGMRKEKFGGDVPYRCFVPKRIEGLLIGCRALSQDRDCGMALRMQRDIHKVGEVAGVAAALSVREGVLPRNVNVQSLQHRLVERGVLQAEDLQRESEPWMIFEGESRDERKRLLERLSPLEMAEQLISHLGGPEEDTALWWMIQLGEPCIEPLLQQLPSATGAKRRGIAFALGLLRHPAGIPVLAETFRSKDAAKKPDPLTCSEERFIAALILLTVMQSDAVIDDAVQILGSERKSSHLLFILQYFIRISPKMSVEQKKQTAEAVLALLQRPDLGDDFIVKGSHGITPTLGKSTSMKWGIELSAAYLLELLGHRGKAILDNYLKDERKYAVNAAELMLARLANPEGSASV